MKCEMPWLTAYAIADNAARLLAEERPRPQEPGDGFPEDYAVTRKVRSFLRENPVAALRWLWQTGNYSVRACVAARVLVWLKHDEERVKITSRKVESRERDRLKLQEAA